MEVSGQTNFFPIDKNVIFEIKVFIFVRILLELIWTEIEQIFIRGQMKSIDIFD